MLKVYVAHTYGRRWGNDETECRKNAQKAIEWGRKLLLLGYNPFIPNLYHYVSEGWADSPDETAYFEVVSSWLDFCDCLFVAEAPPNLNSGVYKEIEIAKELCIPVYYSIEELTGRE